MERENTKELKKALGMSALRTVEEMADVARRAAKQLHADEAHSCAAAELSTVITDALAIAGQAWRHSQLTEDDPHIPF